jgi:hypothetical protein
MIDAHAAARLLAITGKSSGKSIHPVNEFSLEKYLLELSDLPEFTGLAPVGINTCGGWRSTPLHIAAVQGNVKAIEALIDAGANIQCCGEHGFSPLHEAVGQGDLDAVRVLLDRGASLAALTDDGYTPIQLAHALKLNEMEDLLRLRSAASLGRNDQ